MSVSCVFDACKCTPSLFPCVQLFSGSFFVSLRLPTFLLYNFMYGRDHVLSNICNTSASSISLSAFSKLLMRAPRTCPSTSFAPFQEKNIKQWPINFVTFFFRAMKFVIAHKVLSSFSVGLGSTVFQINFRKCLYYKTETSSNIRKTT